VTRVWMRSASAISVGTLRRSRTASMTSVSTSRAGIRLTVPACLGLPCRRADEI
jgi:hypothetical protein